MANTEAIIKAAVDDWNYRAITLQNGITAMLISDPEADKASASMDVRTPPCAVLHVICITAALVCDQICTFVEPMLYLTQPFVR